MWYNRPNSDGGDSLTDVAALALIGGYDCAKHIRACQRPDGSIFRHPNLPESTLSRDHTISLCNYTTFSQDKEPLRKFFWYCVRHGGKMCPGSVGQSMQNLYTWTCMLMALGGFYRFIGTCLSLICVLFLPISAKFLPVGWRLIMVSEYILIFRLNTPRVLHYLYHFVSKMVLKRQDCNLFYEVVDNICTHTDSEYLTPRVNTCKMTQDWLGCDNSWLWCDPRDGRHGTGVDVQYILALIKHYKG